MEEWSRLAVVMEKTMVEFDVDESFDEWTASFLGLTSLDGERRQAQVQGAEDCDKLGPSKDNLEKIQDVHDRTESLIVVDEDPGHSGVMLSGEQRADSRVGVTSVRKTQEYGQDGTLASTCPETTD